MFGEPEKTNECDQALNEIRIMLSYALAAGKELDPETRSGLGLLERCPGAPASADSSADFSRILGIHAALAKIVAPATPRSLKATEPVKITLWRPFKRLEPFFNSMGSLLNPPLIPILIFIALIAMIGFIWTLNPAETPPSPHQPQQPSAQPAPAAAGADKPAMMRIAPARPRALLNEVSMENTFTRKKPATILNTVAFETAQNQNSPQDKPLKLTRWTEINWCCAAALGAVFFVAFQAHEYIKNRTYDPQYFSVYLIRLFLGILAGMILANVVASTKLSTQLEQIGLPVIALLGGFSTDAVNQVLLRLVEIVLAAVRGDGAQAAKTKATQDAQNELLTLAADPAFAGNTALLSKIHAAIKKVGQ
jgi:hypothetical protein